MRKKINNIVCIAIMFASILSYANSDYSLNTGKGSSVLTLKEVKKGQQLLIKDANLSILYRESITHNGTYTKGFDLTSLPDGTYYFELDKDLEIVTIPFTITSNEVQFEKEKETVIYKPTVRVVDNKLFVSRLSLEKESLKVKIYYEKAFEGNSILVFSENIEGTKIASRIYELSKKKKGDYTIVFTTQGREFTKRIKL